MTTAERIAQIFGDDGQCYELPDGRTLDGVCDRQPGVVRFDTRGHTRWLFRDESSIVSHPSGWDVGNSPRCGCMAGAGHADDCDGEP